MDRSAATQALEGAIETFIIDWPVLIFIGLLFGAFAPENAPWSSRAFKAGLITSVAFAVTAFVSYVVAPDWMWMYFLDPDGVAWSLPVVALAYPVTFGLGFAAALGLRVVSRSIVFGAAVASLVAEVVIVAITWDRYRFVGSTKQWLTDQAVPLFGTSPEGPVRVISLLGPLFVVVFVAALVWTFRSRRETAADR